MPKEYITRLEFDRRHKLLALLSNNPNKKDCDEEVTGLIFFCAVSASQQVKDYGTKLMNLFKIHAVTEGIEYFTTYADNYSIGWMKMYWGSCAESLCSDGLFYLQII